LYSTGKHVAHRRPLHDGQPHIFGGVRGGRGDHDDGIAGDGLRVCPRAWGRLHDGVCAAHQRQGERHSERVTSVELTYADGGPSLRPCLVRVRHSRCQGLQGLSPLDVERDLVSITVSPDTGKGGRETRRRLSMVLHARLGCCVRELVHSRGADLKWRYTTKSDLVTAAENALLTVQYGTALSELFSMERHKKRGVIQRRPLCSIFGTM
jgi:hypothetical protein